MYVQLKENTPEFKKMCCRKYEDFKPKIDLMEDNLQIAESTTNKQTQIIRR